MNFADDMSITNQLQIESIDNKSEEFMRFMDK